jgi:peroxiredoxin Q/BCP
MALLEKGTPAPDFEMQDADGKTWRLSDLRGQGVILYFYPADDTPGCTLEACGFRDSIDVWNKADYVVLGVSPQGADSKRAFTEKYALNFPLLIDEDRSVQRAYGTELKEAVTYKDIEITTKRSTFVIDENGVIDEALYGVNPQKHIEELRSRLGA